MADEDSRRDASLGGREGSDGSQADVPQAAEPRAAAEGQPHAGKKGRRTRVLAGVLVALLLAVVLAVVALMPRGSGQATATSEPEAQPITVKFVTPNYDESTDSKIPLEVKGRTAADAEYDETFYVSPSTPQLEVPAGTYELSLPASPLLATGDVYVLPESVALDTKAVAGDGAAAPEVAFEVKPAEDVTKEDVDAAKAAAQASGFDAGRVEDLASTVVRRQVAALYGGILDNVRDVDFSSGAKDGFAPQAFAYALQDINGDGMPDLLVSGDKDGIQRYCAWVGSPDGSGVTQVEVPEDLVTRKGYASSLQFLLSGSNVGDGLLYSQVLGSGAAIPTTQRYVVRDGALVAEGDPILSQSTTQLASEVLAESVELAFVDVSDRSPLESYAKDGEVAAPNGEKGLGQAQAQGQAQSSQSAGAASDAAISDAKARGLVVLAGTVRTVSGSDAIDLCESVGAMSSSEAAATRSFFTSTYPKALTETYTVFVLDEPQEIAWGEPGEGLSTDGRKTYVVSLGSDLGSYDGQHVTAAFDNSRSAWASQSNPLGKSPSCSSVEVLAVG